MKAVRQSGLLYGERDQQLSAERRPDLDGGAVEGVREKPTQSEMLLRPFERQFDLPAMAINQGDGRGGQIEVFVGENQRQLGLHIVMVDAAQSFGAVAPRLIPVQLYGLVARPQSRWLPLLRLPRALLVMAMLTVPTLAQTYQYDASSRLTNVTYSSGASISYSYDAAGNRLTQSAPTGISFATQPSNQTVTVGGAVTFTVVATGTAPLSYQWYVNGTLIDGATSSSYTISSATAANAGSYTVTVTGSSGSATSSAAILTVNPPGNGPTITTQPSIQTVTVGGTVTFTVGAAGTPPLSYQWYFNGAYISGATSSSYTIISATAANDGSYTATVTNSAGTVTSNPATLTVNGPIGAPVITQQPVWTVDPDLLSVTLSVVATGSGLTYQWQYNVTNIAGATNATLIIAGARLSQAGNYTVVVTNPSGSAVSNPVAAVIPTQPAVQTQPSSQSVWLNGRVVFTVGATGGSLTYQWLQNGAAINGATGPTLILPAVQGSNAGTYSVMITNPAGSVTSSKATLTINLAPGATYISTWSAFASLPASPTYDDVAYDGSNFMAIGSDGSVYVSPNGLAWTKVSPYTAPWGQLNSLISLGGNYSFIAVSSEGEVLTFPVSGYTTPNQIYASRSTLTGVAASSNEIVVVGYSGTIIRSSLLATIWNAAAPPTAQNLNAVTYGGNIFVAVGLGGTVLTSPDGIAWTAQRLGFNTDLYGVAYGGATFTAVGGSGAIFTSPDGINWLPASSPATSTFVRVKYANGVFVIVGLNGTIVTSTDGGTTWTAQTSGTANRLNGITYGANSFLAVGAQGTVVQSAVALARLINLSMLSNIQGSLSMGFVIGGIGTSGSESLLIRGVGPSIGPGTPFNVPGVMLDPTLTVYQQSPSTTIAANAGWGSPASNAQTVEAADAATGAFPLTITSSLDSAVELNLPPVTGGYSATVAGKSGDNGYVLTEVYDDTVNYTTASTRLINLSCLTQIAVGGTLDVGFVVGGSTSKTVLVRVGGPALNALYGISGVMPDPQLQISPLGSSSTVLASDAGWGGNSQIATVAASVGAYTWPSLTSLDSAAVVTLAPGAYTVQVNGASGDGGTILVEIYDVP